MSIKFSEEWRQYKKIIDEIDRLQVQTNLFPGRTQNKEEIKKLQKKLFEYYEGFINKSNTINPIVLRMTIKDYFKKNCKVKTGQEVDEWIDKQDWDDARVISDIADDIIGKNIEYFCFKNQGSFCPQTKCEQCAFELIYEIIKNSDKYTHILRTDENLQLFLNGASQYLKKEVTQQESNSSPIEDIMYEALKPLAKKYNLKLEKEYPVYDTGRTEIRYSLDLVFTDHKNNPILNIETDGLTFHNSYQNMALDRARDRWLLIRGIPVMRFTSRDVFSDLTNSTIQIEAALKTVLRWKGRL